MILLLNYNLRSCTYEGPVLGAGDDLGPAVREGDVEDLVTVSRESLRTD